MKHSLFVLAPLLGAVLLAGAPVAGDSSLDGVWFKARLGVTGYVIDPVTHEPQEFAAGTRAFVHFTSLGPRDATSDDGRLDPPATTYRYDLWTETVRGTWELTYWSTTAVESTDGGTYFIPSLPCELRIGPQALAEATMTLMIQVKRDRSGRLVSATLASLGGQVYDGTLDGTDALRGGIRLRGKSIEPDRLPFVR